MSVKWNMLLKDMFLTKAVLKLVNQMGLLIDKTSHYKQMTTGKTDKTAQCWQHLQKAQYCVI